MIRFDSISRVVVVEHGASGYMYRIAIIMSSLGCSLVWFVGGEKMWRREET
jgi:hypothetical protein